MSHNATSSAERIRDAIPTYNTCIGLKPYEDYAQWHDHDGKKAGKLAKSLLADSISAMKIWPFDPFSERSWGQRITASEVERGLAPVRSIRDPVGTDVESGIESHFRLNRFTIQPIP